MTDTEGNKKVYTWLRDEFLAGNCPCWFGNSFDVVWAAMQHAIEMEKQLAAAKGEIQELRNQLKGEKS